LLLHREDIEGYDLWGGLQSQPITVRRGYPQIYGKGRISGSADELFETVVIGTLGSEFDTHAPIMDNRVKSSTLSMGNRS